MKYYQWAIVEFHTFQLNLISLSRPLSFTKGFILPLIFTLSLSLFWLNLLKGITRNLSQGGHLWLRWIQMKRLCSVWIDLKFFFSFFFLKFGFSEIEWNFKWQESLHSWQQHKLNYWLRWNWIFFSSTIVFELVRQEFSA
jgi:hypothetical protein